MCKFHEGREEGATTDGILNVDHFIIFEHQYGYRGVIWKPSISKYSRNTF